MAKKQSEEQHTMEKVSEKKHAALRGKLLEVRKIGATPIFIEVKKDTIEEICKKADVPTTSDIKVEGVKTGSKKWVAVELSDNAEQFDKIAITTKVSGANF